MVAKDEADLVVGEEAVIKGMADKEDISTKLRTHHQ